uniref:Uncharacterized protein n=1 Tax=Ciona savignyi TaxID=51511 RepID=H2Z5M3_CIOSA
MASQTYIAIFKLLDSTLPFPCQFHVHPLHGEIPGVAGASDCDASHNPVIYNYGITYVFQTNIQPGWSMKHCFHGQLEQRT